MRLQAVLFDIDGTLIDSVDKHVIAWNLAFQSEGLPQEEDHVRAQIGKGSDLLLPALLPDADEQLRRRISRRHADLFQSIYLDEVRPFAGATALVRKVHEKGLKVSLASSAAQKEVAHYIRVLGIEDAVSATVSIDDVETSKPSPDIFAVALGKLDLSPESAIAVGDTPYDVIAALAAGLNTIGVSSGPFSRAELIDAGAAAVYDDVSALLKDFDTSALSG